MFEVAKELETALSPFTLREWHAEIETALGLVLREVSLEAMRNWRVQPPDWAGWGTDDADVFVHQWALHRRGQVVFGHLVQANNLIFEPGEFDLAASILYSRDPHFLDAPEPLSELVEKLMEWKMNGGTTDRRFDTIVAGLIDERTRMSGVPIPRNALDGRAAYMARLFLHRKHLPDGYLNFSSPIPLLVTHEGEGMCRIIPSMYWGSACKVE